MIFYYFLALLAAFCWSISSLISADITRVLGGIGFNRLRLIFVSFMLLIYSSLQICYEKAQEPEAAMFQFLRRQ